MKVQQIISANRSLEVVESYLNMAAAVAKQRVPAGSLRDDLVRVALAKRRLRQFFDALGQLDVEQVGRPAAEGARSIDLEVLAREVDRTSVTLEAASDEEGNLQSPIGAADIVTALWKRGASVAPGQIGLKAPIKELGLYKIPVNLAPEVNPDLKVWVVPH